MKCLVISLLVIAFTAPAFSQHHHPPNIVVLVDGSKAPDLIPDTEAWKQTVFRFASHSTPTEQDRFRLNWNFYQAQFTKSEGDTVVQALKGVREALDEDDGSRRNAILDAAVDSLKQADATLNLKLMVYMNAVVKTHTVITGEVATPNQSGPPPPTCHYSFTTSFDVYPVWGAVYGTEAQSAFNEVSVVDNSACNHSQYITTSTFTASDNVQGTSQQQGLEATSFININPQGVPGDVPVGIYNAVMQMSFYCPYIGTIAYSGAGIQIKFGVGITYYRNPANLGIGGLSLICYYSVLNCTQGTYPTCNNPASIYFDIADWSSCAKYITAFFVTETVVGSLGGNSATLTMCSPVGVTLPSGTTGGACT